MSILIAIYVIAALLLAVYGFNSWVLSGLYLKHRPKPENTPRPKNVDQPLPAVTVQLPIFNEALVVERLIGAVTQLDYPRHLLQIQVLDDSTDETTELAAELVEQHQQQGINITLIHRTDRSGFKAGALKAAMPHVTGEYIAIFDADFVPPQDFLLKTVPHLVDNPNLGFVQTRWGHLNSNYSSLTAAQALAIDGHFVIEQTARNRTGMLMNFNGTAGVWRRACIDASGGWQADTICEDFDLSYRAQLDGWQCLYLPHVVAPAEIPPQLAAFKRQQFRWAKGSIQCLKKLGGQVLRSPLAWPVKLQSMIHLSNYMAHPLLVILAVLTPLFIMTGATENIRFPLIYLSLASLGPPFLYALAQASLYPTSWKRRYKMMPILMFVGGGIALSSTKAVIEALLGTGNNFRRTPKFNVVSNTDRWQESHYRLPLNWLVVAELALGLYSLVGAVYAAANDNLFAVPFILLYAFSFGYVGLRHLWDARQEFKQWFFGRSRRGAGRAAATQKQPLRIKQADALER